MLTSDAEKFENFVTTPPLEIFNCDDCDVLGRSAT